MSERRTNWLKVWASLMMVVGIVVVMAQQGWGAGLLFAGFILFVVSRFRD